MNDFSLFWAPALCFSALFSVSFHSQLCLSGVPHLAWQDAIFFPKAFGEI